MQKTIFITGASSGLGKATAILFQSRGWKVIATMRNPENETELRKLDNVSLLKLDVCDSGQITEIVQQVLAAGAVDVVFNNAGYGLIGAVEALSDEQIVRQLNTNLLGVLRVTKAFIPYFREKGEGLFITTTSMGGFLTFPLGSVYHATKFALEGWSESMSYELGTFGIGIKTVAPGAIATDFSGRSLDTRSLPAYSRMEEKLFSTMEQMMQDAAEPVQIAEVVYEAATDGKDQVRYIAGEDARTMYARQREIGNEAFRKQMRAMTITD
ncbi:Short-chain dehydrogenase [Sinomicrobium oceani]|uniref:Short-chain dehydrogenase n=1 Tax=Sinomicrobium oceani TaxID=1150368 RepID=A0A1K1RY17_9FLAO|nr:SDR family oxidoreductase [Sinomicrobium oceani]SFW76942.1 Short-chain dehydrogenase [Sinomicrobium oceani]